MNTADILVPERAEIDIMCDHCEHEITIGEDYYYDQDSEEILCADCANQQ